MSEPVPVSTLRTFRIVIEYDGTGLNGWQKQLDHPSVQGHLEQALARLVGEATKVTGASRTDAGVHALGQVAMFKSAAPIPPEGFIKGINAFVPKSIAVTHCKRVADDFNPRFKAIGKTYRYQILLRDLPAPMMRHRVWQRETGVDVALMHDAAQALCGEHDFSAFRATGCGAQTAIRRIDAISVNQVDDTINIIVEGNAFLRNMVRIIAGTLLEIGERRRAPASIEKALQSKHRPDAGITAPPQGLTLMKVHYP